MMYFGPVGDGEMSDEQRAEMERQHQLQLANQQDWYNRLYAFVESADQELLETASTMVTIASNNSSFAPHLVGMINLQLRQKFGVCSCDGTTHKVSDHDVRAADLEPKPDTQIPGEPGWHSGWAPWAKEHPEEYKELDRWLARHAGSELWDQTRSNMMSLYSLRATPVEGAKARVTCTLCGMIYVSLEDRMLKLPGVEHCPGCVDRTKWG